MNEGQAASMSIWLFMDYRLYVGCLFVLEATHGVSKKKKKVPLPTDWCFYTVYIRFGGAPFVAIYPFYTSFHVCMSSLREMICRISI